MKRAKRIKRNKSIFKDRFRLHKYIKQTIAKNRYLRRDGTDIDRDGYDAHLTHSDFHKSHKRWHGAKYHINKMNRKTRNEARIKLHNVVKDVVDPEDISIIEYKADPWWWD